MVAINDVLNFLTDFSGIIEINPESDISADLGINGDDFHEMIEIFSQKYRIDMSEYLEAV